MAGTIGNVIVSWTVDTPDGPRSAAIDLASMRKHCRPERVEDLLDDLTVLCEDVLAGQKGTSRRNTRLRALG